MTKHGFTIKTITPIHIWSGNEYGASEYIESKAKTTKGEVKKIFKRINIDEYYSSLSNDKKDEFIANLADGAFKLGDYDKNIKFRKYIAQDRCNKKPTVNQKIKEHIRSARKFFIPGSSIKGAIKTALLYNLIDEYKIPNLIDFLITKTQMNKNDYKEFEKRYDRFMKKIFSSYNGNPAQYNIMRFMIVADSSSIEIPSIYDVISVMANKYGKYQYYSRNGNIVRSFIETIYTKRNLKSSIALDYNSDVISELNLNDKEKVLNLNYIKQSIYNFSKDYIKHEQEFSNRYNIDYLEKFYKKIEKMNTPETPLLKIGAGSGFLATTINLKVKNYNEYYYNKVRETLRHTYGFEFPKSRKILPSGGLPLGWTQLNFD